MAINYDWCARNNPWSYSPAPPPEPPLPPPPLSKPPPDYTPPDIDSWLKQIEDRQKRIWDDAVENQKMLQECLDKHKKREEYIDKLKQACAPPPPPVARC